MRLVRAKPSLIWVDIDRLRDESSILYAKPSLIFAEISMLRDKTIQFQVVQCVFQAQPSVL